MDQTALIDRLAVQAGIVPSFYDIHGTLHTTSAETKLRVLSALGVDASSAAGARHCLAELARAAWTTTTLTCGADRENEVVDIVVPAHEADAHWLWRLDLESGDVRQAEFTPEKLPLLGAEEVDGVRLERRSFKLEHPVPAGYHRLSIEGRQRKEWSLIAVPSTCYLAPPLADDQRLWGLSAHLYTVRSQQNWGIGDFADLQELLCLAGASGASFVGLNPFHALHATRPLHASPYSPSSRLFLNTLYVAVFGHPVPPAVDQLRRERLVDYGGVVAAKRLANEESWNAFQNGRDEASSATHEAFARFVLEGRDSLRAFSTFCAIDEHVNGQSPDFRSWHAWPDGLRRPDTSAVAAFAREQASRVGFHMYLQFLADRQLADAQRAARQAGMAIGIIRDLAVGIDPDGADAWAGQETFARNLRCGAPRDAFHPTGQEWGVLPFNPMKLKSDPLPFAQLLRANMRHAGGLRVDHIIGLERQFLVPVGEPATNGCYVRYPRDLLGLVALESRRNRCMIIGEDLGTVPEGLRERMHEMQMFGCSILPFERSGDARFRSPAEYRRRSMASAGTHDLPTIRCYWRGDDIDLRERLGLQNAQASVQARAQRAEDRTSLLAALVQAGSLRNEVAPTVEELRDALHSFLSASAAGLFAAQLDDLLDEGEQLNVPGTVDSYPNWRRKLSAALEDRRLTHALAGLALLARRAGRV